MLEPAQHHRMPRRIRARSEAVKVGGVQAFAGVAKALCTINADEVKSSCCEADARPLSPAQAQELRCRDNYEAYRVGEVDPLNTYESDAVRV